MRRRIGDPARASPSRSTRLGGVHHFRGDFDLARSMFIESLDLKQGLGNANCDRRLPDEPRAPRARRGSVPEVAAAAFDEAIAIWERIGRPPAGRRSASTTRRLLALDRGRLDEAVVLLTRAYETAREHRRPHRRWPTRWPTSCACTSSAATSTRRACRSRRPCRGPRRWRRGSSSCSPSRGPARTSPPRAATTGLADPPLVRRRRRPDAVSGFANMPADTRLLAARMADARERPDAIRVRRGARMVRGPAR